MFREPLSVSSSHPFVYINKVNNYSLSIQLNHVKEIHILEVGDHLEIWCSGIECWVCGLTGKMEYHHTLPKHLKPKKNVIVPVCHECHEKITIHDLPGLGKFAYRLKKMSYQLAEELGQFSKRVHTGAQETKLTIGNFFKR